MRPPRLILASGSPRRAAVLRQLGLPFEVRLPAIDETLHEEEGPAEAAERLARAKAERGVAAGALALGFDTLVEHRGAILGKPATAADAIRMLGRLTGDAHTVHTGIALAGEGRLESAVEATRVWFRTLPEEERERYVGTGEPLDKAGSYGIQGFGAALVHRIEGDFFNVLGFPVPRFLELLERMGWRYDFGRLVRGGSGEAPEADSP